MQTNTTAGVAVVTRIVLFAVRNLLTKQAGVDRVTEETC